MAETDIQARKHTVRSFDDDLSELSGKIVAMGGLVERIDYQTVPPHVEYQLTALGRSLSRTLVVVDQWAEANIAKLVSAQQAFDQAAG